MSKTAKKYLKKNYSCDRYRGEEPYGTAMYYKKSVIKIMDAYNKNQLKKVSCADEIQVAYKKGLEHGSTINVPLPAHAIAKLIFDWLQSSDCWITDKDGNVLPDAIIDGKDLNKRLETYLNT